MECEPDGRRPVAGEHGALGKNPSAGSSLQRTAERGMGSGKVLWANPGEPWGGEGDAEITVFDLQNPEQLPDRPVLSTFHSHPSGTYTVHNNMRDPSGMESIGGASSTTRYVDQGPSPRDITNAAIRSRNGVVTGNSYVIGASNRTVSIYNGTGTLTMFPMSSWLTLGR